MDDKTTAIRNFLMKLIHFPLVAVRVKIINTKTKTWKYQNLGLIWVISAKNSPILPSFLPNFRRLLLFLSSKIPRKCLCLRSSRLPPAGSVHPPFRPASCSLCSPPSLRPPPSPLFAYRREQQRPRGASLPVVAASRRSRPPKKEPRSFCSPPSCYGPSA